MSLRPGQDANLPHVSAYIPPAPHPRRADLHTLGGLAPVVALLAEPHPTPIRAAAAHVIGTAASNNLKFIRQLVSLHPRIPHALLAITQLRDDAAAAKGLYALGTVVRGSREARAAFYAASGLSQLEAAAAPGAAQSERVRTKALHLLTDLLELTTFDEGGGSDASQQQQQQQQQEDGRGNAEIERLAAGVLPQFAGAALQLLQTAESLRAQETALLALHTILAKRPQDGREALEAMGAEGVLREALVALEAALLTGEDAAEEARREAAGLKPREGGGGEQSAGEDQGEDPGEFGDGSDPSYRHYLVGLCADLLQDLSAEQGFLGHDEL
jgi:nucleotide exchange factor SIL1